MLERVKKYLSVLELSHCRDAISFQHSKADFLFYNTMETEIWKEIKGFEGYYQISNLGEVKSVKRVVIRSNKMKLSVKERFMKQTLCQGYYYVDLFKEGKKTRSFIHRLIALHFIDNPQNKPSINHINGIKNDNSISNLEWATQKDNIIHAYGAGLMDSSLGENSNLSTLKEKQVIEIRNLYNSGLTNKTKIGSMFGVTRGAIRSIVNHKSWKHL